MDRDTQLKYEARAKILKALAHPSRLFIVDELSSGEKCVADITEKLGLSMPTVSRHLSKLKEAGILTDERRGNQMFYRLGIGCIPQFFGCVEEVLRGNLQNQIRVFKGLQ